MNITVAVILIILLIVAGFLSVIAYIRNRTVALKDQLDGRLTELLKVTKELAHAQGLAEGKAGRADVI